LGGVAAAWPLGVRAQQNAMPVIGYLHFGSPNLAPTPAVFLQGLSETGFVEGQNVEVEYRYADNQNDRLSALAADLIRRSVSVIVANYEGARVIKDAKPTVPIVFAYGGDPVKDGFVASLNRPGGNVTGVVFFGASNPAIWGPWRTESQVIVAHEGLDCVSVSRVIAALERLRIFEEAHA